MIKFLKLGLLPLFLLLTSFSHAQHVTVSATVLDPTPNHVPYRTCSGSASFVGQNTTPGAGPYLLGGSTFQTVVPITCDSFARFTISLSDNLLISPTPSQWNFSICTAFGAYPGPPICFNTLITITGTTQDVSTQLQAAAVPLPPYAVTLETNGVLNGNQGLLNLIAGSNITIVDDGHGNVTISSTGGGGGGGGGVCGATGELQYNNNGACGSVANTTAGFVLASSGIGVPPTWTKLPQILVTSTGAKGDGQVATDCYMTSGSAVLTCETSHFVPGDVGKPIAVYGDGPTTSGFIQPLSTTILTYTSGTQVTLNANAGNSTTHLIPQISSCTRAQDVATCTTSTNHNFAIGQMVNINNVGASGFTQDSSFVGVWPIRTIPAANQFTINSYLLNDVTGVTGGVADGHSERVVWGTDNTAAIQAAVDAAASAGGGSVLFPSGLYLTHGINMTCSQVGNWTGYPINCLRAYNNITLAGEGASVSQIENWDVNVSQAAPWDSTPGAGHPGVIFIGRYSPGDFDVPTAGFPTTVLNHINIHDLTIRQAKHMPSGAKAIYDFASDDVEIRNNTVMNFSYEGIYQGGKSVRWNVHDNYVTQTGEGGPSVSTSTSALNQNGWYSTFHDNRVDDSGQCMEGAGHDDFFVNNSCDMRGPDSASASPLLAVNLSSATFGTWRWVIKGNRIIGGNLGAANGNGIFRDVSIEDNFMEHTATTIGSGKETNNVNYGPQPPGPHGISSFSNNTLMYSGLKYPVTYPFSISGAQPAFLENVIVKGNRIMYKTGYCSNAPHTSCLSTSDCSSGSCTVPVGMFSIIAPGVGPTWTALTAYATNTAVTPSVENGYIYMNKGSSGTSAAGEPVWCTTTNPPCTVVDGTVTWTLYDHRPKITFDDNTMASPPGLATYGAEFVASTTPPGGYSLDRNDYNLALRMTIPGATTFTANTSILNRNEQFITDNAFTIGAATFGRPSKVFAGTDFVGPIGVTTPNTGAFTTITATSGTFSGQPGINTGTASNTDLTGELAFSASTTSASYTFAGTYVSAPECSFGLKFDPGAHRVWISTLSTTTLQFSSDSAQTGAVSYVCHGRN